MEMPIDRDLRVISRLGVIVPAVLILASAS
jgi:hypothetical protein